MVIGLKNCDKTVAVTGDGINDIDALEHADVGLAMGSGCSAAKQVSSLILANDDFESSIRAVMWGRNIYHNVGRFLQFQLTVNISTIFLVILGILFFGESPLSAVHLLWINLIMDTLAALALATEPPREELLNRKPHKKTEYIITPLMIKHIIAQSILQTIVLLIVVFSGEKFLFELHRDSQKQSNSNLIIKGREKDGYDKKNFNNQYSIHFTYIFNIFVMLQFFNFINCRMIHDELNIFKYISKSTYLIVILIIILVLQVILLTFGGPAIRVHQWGLSPSQWGLCILVGLLGFPVRYLMVLLKFEKCCNKGVGSKAITQEELEKKSSVT